MRNIKHKIFFTFFLATIALGQSFPPPTSLITVPTAGSLTRGSYSLGMRIQDEGGMIGTLQAGITDRFQFGLSFGSPNLIGDDSLKWYPRPEAHLKYQVIDESMSLPGVALGVNTQGFGDFVDSLDRYDTKAYGVYLLEVKIGKHLLGILDFILE